MGERDPGGEREAIAVELVGAVCVTLARLGHGEAAAVTWFNFDTLARCQDWSRLRVGDVSSTTTEVAVEFGVQRRGERCKTGHAQGCVLRTPYAKRVLRARCRGRAASQRVFLLSVDEYRRQWRAALEKLGFSEGEVGPPHVLRHAGAAHLALREQWEMAAIKLRGRWDSDRSLKRYGKQHVVVRMLAALPSHVQKMGAEFLRDPIRAMRAARAN